RRVLFRSYWAKVIEVREAVAKEIEKARNADRIGGSLEARVELYCPEPLQSLLKALGDELHFVLITSYAEVQPLEAKPADASLAALDDDTELFVRVVPLDYEIGRA